MVTESVAPITRRAIPTQARSAHTVEKILSAASDVLFERGLQGLNTNAVAARAGINVATLYHYFPDKVAILAELFRRDQGRRSQYLAGRLEELPDVANLVEWTTDLINSLVELRTQLPVTAVLRQACRTVPQLIAMEEEDNDVICDAFAKILRQRFRHLSPNRARNCARTMIETGAALMDRVILASDHAPHLVRETIVMLSSYLEHLESST